MKNSDFRIWFVDCYAQNREERLTYQQEPYTVSEYLSKFKWWLRKKYRNQCRKEIKQREINERFKRWA